MKANDIVEGQVIKISSTHLIVQLKNAYKGLLHISEISDYFVKNISSFFKIGSKGFFLILKTDEKTKRANLSWKKINPKFLRNPFKFSIKETESGFKNLKNQTEKLLRKRPIKNLTVI